MRAIRMRSARAARVLAQRNRAGSEKRFLELSGGASQRA
jgi:hypothetical protein